MPSLEDVQARIARYREVVTTSGLKHDGRTGRAFFSSYGRAVYDWELYFDAIVLSYLGSTEPPVNALRMFLESQRKDGFICRRIVPDYDPTTVSEVGRAYHVFEEDEHCKPFLFQTALVVSRALGGTGWLSRGEYRKLARYLEHWLTHWDRDGNGLCEWSSGPHSGADTQFSRVGPWRARYCEGVDLNAYLVQECRAAAVFGDRDRWLGEAEAIAERMRSVFWNDGAGLFFDRDSRNGSRIPVRAASAFLTLWAGIATPDQARRLVQEHLTNPAEFWTPFPVSSYARSQPEYTQLYRPPVDSDPTVALTQGHCNWCGGMWPHWSYLIAHGLERYGYREVAESMAQRLWACSTGGTGLSEWYDAETGSGCGMNPFWAGASALALFLPLEIEVGWDPTRISAPTESAGLVAVREAAGLKTGR